jgi:hypothetical protein
MACTGVVGRYIGRRLQPGAQNRLRFADEFVLFVRQQALHLAFRDRHAHGLQQRHQPRQCRLPLMIVHQHEAAQVRTEMAIDPRRQGGQDRLAIRRDPALAQIARRPGRNHQLLHEKGLVAFEARSRRHRRRLDHLVLDNDPRRHLATQPPLRLLGGLHRLVALSMPLGLIAGRLFKPFRRAISSRCSPTIFSRAATLPRSSTTSASSSARLRSGKDGGGGTSTQIVSHHAGASEKCSTARGFAPIASK